MTVVLVLGASGFLGSHVARACELHPDVARVVPFGRQDLDLAVADVDEVGRAVEDSGCDVVVNCTGRLDGSPEELARANLYPTVALVQALGDLSRPVRLLRLGSAGEYGPVGMARAVREDDPTWPVNLYGATHLAATHVLRSAVEQELLDGTTLRVFNPVGPDARGPNLVWQVAQRLAEALTSGSTSITTGSLASWRDFVDARDVGRAVASAATRTGLPPIVNLGSGRATSVKEVVTALTEIAGFTGAVLQAGTGPARSAGVSWIAADIATARRSLGWEPATDLRTSLRDVWDSIRHLHVVPAQAGA